MLKEIRPAIIVLVVLTPINGPACPLAMTALAGAIFPKQAHGSLIERDGKVVGSALIGREAGEGDLPRVRVLGGSPSPQAMASTFPRKRGEVKTGRPRRFPV